MNGRDMDQGHELCFIVNATHQRDRKTIKFMSRGGFQLKATDTCVHVSNIPYGYRWQDLKELFNKEVGEVLHVEIAKPKPGGKIIQECAIIEFKSAELQREARKKMHKYDLNNRKLCVKEVIYLKTPECSIPSFPSEAAPCSISSFPSEAAPCSILSSTSEVAPCSISSSTTASGTKIYPPWWNSDCADAIRYKRAAWKKYRVKQTPESHVLFKEASSEARRVIRAAKQCAEALDPKSPQVDQSSQQVWKS
ncbi:uncharacterized protein [Procambarus clarkii]|uniref:uncharacterized protein n=1 Tax=Procambarus clarkii TaxID=6728 RepID=UPI001E675AC8|nr:uncharacterized protein LOC123755728 [Procambarus clarkii]